MYSRGHEKICNYTNVIQQMQIALKFTERKTVSLSVLLRSLDWNRIIPLEGTYKDHQIQPPDHFRDEQKLKIITGAQRLLKCDKHRASTVSVGSLFHCSTTLTRKEFFLISTLTLL